jgi:iron complex transport system substrate-binding protein
MDGGEPRIAAIERDFSEVRSRTARSSRPRVWCEEWGKPIIASQTWAAELVEAAGGDFVGAAGQHAAAGEVQRLDPELIIAAWCGAGDRVPLEKIIPERGWQRTAAALSGRIFCVRDEFLNTPAPTLLQGLRALAFAIHPELFPPAKGIRRMTAVPASTAKNSPA